MTTLQVENLESTYRDYLTEAERVKKERLRVFNRYRIVMILGVFIAIAPLLGILPTQLFWVGIVVVVVFFGLGYYKSNKQADKMAAESAVGRPGFSEFYNLYFHSYWTNEMPTGKELEKFMSLLGQKGL